MSFVFSRPFGRALALAVAALSITSGSASASAVVDRDEFSTTVDLGGGKLKTTLSSEPLNYQTDSGAWKPVDLELEAQPDGTVRPQGVDGDLAIPKSLGSPVELEHDGKSATLHLLGASGDIDVAGPEATFEAAMPGVDVSYVARPYGVKEALTLATPLVPGSFAYELRASGLWSASMDRGDVVLRDSAGTERYRISAPLAWDSAEDPAFTNALALSVSKLADGRWRVMLRPDAAWLADTARVYPVTIDPDFSWSNGTTHFNGAQDCYLSGYTQANNTFCAQTYLQTGWYNRPYRSIFKFDIAAAIPSNATVSSAVFKAYAPPATPHIAMGHSLHTITSDWDSTATWNNRKAGTPWTTAGGGGDISTNPAYSSSSTSVQAYPAWYSWNAPLAAVQGWVNGSLPNYGFMLRSDNTGNIGNAYAWASTEASTSSQFPADSSKWPSLDVTWSGGDTIAPPAPTNVRTADYDPGRHTVGIEFDEGEDTAPSGVTPSGVDHSEVRVAIRGGAYSGWSSVTDGEYLVVDVFEGDQVVVEVRTVDAAGNVSSVTQKTFSSLRPEESTLDESANYDFAEQYEVSLAVADSWLDQQDSAVDAISELGGGGEDSQIAGGWFDNTARKFHLQVLGPPSSAVADALARHGVAAATQIDTVPFTRELLDARASDLAGALDALLADQSASVSVRRDLEGIRLFITQAARDANLSTVNAAIAAVGVPVSTSIVAQPVAREEREATKQCDYDRSQTYDFFDNEQANVVYRIVGCSGAVRGGTEIRRPKIANNGEDASNANEVSTCTGGVPATSTSKQTPYLLTAGHCFSELDKSEREQLDAWKTEDYSQTRGGPLGSPARISFDPGNPQDLTDAGAIELEHLGDDGELAPFIYRTKNYPKWKIKGVTSLSDKYTKVTDYVPGRMLCTFGSRKSSAPGSSCGELLDTFIARPGYLQEAGDGAVHQIAINTCRTRPGDSGAPVVTRSTGKIAALNNAHVWEQNDPDDPDVVWNTDFFDSVLANMVKDDDTPQGVKFARCYDSTRRGISKATPITEAEKRLNVKVLRRKWQKPARRSALGGVRVSVLAASRVARVNVAIWDGQGNWDSAYDPGASRPGVPGLRLPHLASTDPSDDAVEAFDTSGFGKSLGISVCYASGRGSIPVDVEITDPNGDVRTLEFGLTSVGQVRSIGSTPSSPGVSPPAGSPIASGTWCNGGANANPLAGSCNVSSGSSYANQALLMNFSGAVEDTLFAVNPDGTGARTIRTDGIGTVDSTWSPDRRRVIGSWSDGLYSVSADGSGSAGRMTPAFSFSAYGNYAACSPDGSQMARVRDDGLVEVLSLQSGQTQIVGNNGAFGVSWSPDGKRLAYTTLGTNDTPRIAVVKPDGSDFRVVGATNAAFESFVRWLPDSHYVAYLGSDSSYHGAWSVKSVDAPASTCRRVSSAINGLNRMDVSPDGTALMYGTGFPQYDVVRVTFTTGSTFVVRDGNEGATGGYTVASWGGTVPASSTWSAPTGLGSCS